MKLTTVLFIVLVCGMTGCAASQQQTTPKLEARYYPQYLRPLIGMQEADSRVTHQDGAFGHWRSALLNDGQNSHGRKTNATV